MAETDGKTSSAVRAIQAEGEALRVGGYGVVWGGKDLYDTYFTPETDLWLGKFGDATLALYDHSFNPTMGREVVGQVSVRKADDVGLWIEAEITKHRQYIEPLVDAGVLGWSSGAVSHLVDIDPSGQVRSWPIVEFSLTPTPAEPRTLGVRELRTLEGVIPAIRSYLPEDATETPETGEASAEPERAAETIEVRTLEVTDMDEKKNETPSVDVGALLDEMRAQNEAVRSLMEKLGQQPPEQSGAKVTLENAPKQGSGVRSLGNFLYCVRTGNEKRLREVYGATRTALAEDAGETGGYLVPTEFLPRLLQVAAENAVIRPRATKIPMNGRELNIPMLKQSAQPSSGSTNFFGGVVASWTAEAGTLTETEPAFKNVKLVPHKLAGYTLASDELVADNAIALEALLVRLFGEAIAWFEDYNFMNGNGVGKPLGIFNSPAILSVTRGTDAHFTMPDVGNMLAKFLPSSWGRGVWVMHPTVIPDLLDMRNTGNYPMWTLNIQGPLGTTLMGMPVVFSEKIAALGGNSVLLADFSYYLVGDNGGTEIASSQHYKFINAQTTWRFVHRVDGQPWLDGPLYLQNASDQVSPFVYLADS